MTLASLRPSAGPDGSGRRTILVCVVALMAIVAGCSGTGTTGETTSSEPAQGQATTQAVTDVGTGTETGAGTTGTGSATTGQTTSEPPADRMNASGGSNASLRVAHMSPDAPAVNVIIDGRTVLSDASFPDVSEYLTVPTGQHRVQVVDASAPDTVLLERSVTLEEQAYTLVAEGETTQGPRSSSAFGVSLLTDETTASNENASVRLVHDSPGSGPVDITVNETGEVLFDNVTFGNAATVGVPAGNYTLDIRRGTPENDGEVVDSLTREFAAGTAYTVFAAGYVDPGRAPVGVSFEPIVVTDGLDATVRFAHMSPDADGVDVYVNGQLVDSGLPYTGLTEYYSVPAGNRTVRITPANGSETLFEGPVSLDASTNYTVGAIGETGNDADQPFRPAVFNDDLRTPDNGSARVRLVHATPDGPSIDVENAGSGQVLFDDLAYANATNYTNVPGGNYTLDAFVATPDNTGDDIATFENRTVPGGASYSLFVAGYVTTGDEPTGADVELVIANDTEDYIDRNTLS